MSKLYVTMFSENLSKIVFFKYETIIVDNLKKHFDIYNLVDNKPIDVSKYSLVLITGMVYSYFYTGIHDDEIDKRLQKFSTIPQVVYISHDVHSYSICSSKFSKIKPQTLEHIYNTFFRKFNIKYMISIYDCPEYDKIRDVCKSRLKACYTIHHGCPRAFYYPISTGKKYDVLYYGEGGPVYPLRTRIAKLCGTLPIRFKRFSYNQKTLSNLCTEINNSWISIACVSTFSYFVMKYFEITISNSLVLGDINNQGLGIISTNLIFVNNKMTDNQIKNKIYYYLNNKEIITALSYQGHCKIKDQNYQKYSNKIVDICNSIQKNEINKNYLPKTHTDIKFKDIVHSKEKINIANFVPNGNLLKISNEIPSGLYTITFNMQKNFDKSIIGVYNFANRNIVDSSFISFDDTENIVKCYVPFILEKNNNISINKIMKNNLELYKINTRLII